MDYLDIKTEKGSAWLPKMNQNPRFKDKNKWERGKLVWG
jgi:hypothetical protein